MTAQRMTALMSAVVLTFGLAATSAHATTKGTAQLNQILERMQQEEPGAQSYGGMLQQSQATVNMSNGYVRFVVTDWPVSEAMADGLESVEIKGTLVCQASTGAKATLVDTPSVELDENGQAMFNGQITLPAACKAAPNDLAFFVRTAPADAE